MSRDSHGNPSQPHCASVSWLVLFVYKDILFVCSLCRKKLGIASAGAAGLKEFTQSLNGWGYLESVTLRMSSNETPIEQYNRAPLANRTVIYKHTPERETY